MKEKVKFAFRKGDTVVRLISVFSDEGDFLNHKATKTTPDVTYVCEGGRTEYVLDHFMKWSRELRLEN